MCKCVIKNVPRRCDDKYVQDKVCIPGEIQDAIQDETALSLQIYRLSCTRI